MGFTRMKSNAICIMCPGNTTNLITQWRRLSVNLPLIEPFKKNIDYSCIKVKWALSPLLFRQNGHKQEAQSAFNFRTREHHVLILSDTTVDFDDCLMLFDSESPQT